MKLRTEPPTEYVLRQPKDLRRPLPRPQADRQMNCFEKESLRKPGELQPAFGSLDQHGNRSAGDTREPVVQHGQVYLYGTPSGAFCNCPFCATHRGRADHVVRPMLMVSESDDPFG